MLSRARSSVLVYLFIPLFVGAGVLPAVAARGPVSPEPGGEGTRTAGAPAVAVQAVEASAGEVLDLTILLGGTASGSHEPDAGCDVTTDSGREGADSSAGCGVDLDGENGYTLRISCPRMDELFGTDACSWWLASVHQLAQAAGETGASHGLCSREMAEVEEGYEETVFCGVHHDELGQLGIWISNTWHPEGTGGGQSIDVGLNDGSDEGADPFGEDICRDKAAVYGFVTKLVKVRILGPVADAVDNSPAPGLLDQADDATGVPAHRTITKPVLRRVLVTPAFRCETTVGTPNPPKPREPCGPEVVRAESDVVNVYAGARVVNDLEAGPTPPSSSEENLSHCAWARADDGGPNPLLRVDEKGTASAEGASYGYCATESLRVVVDPVVDEDHDMALGSPPC